jgi:hypothetical protein
VFNSLAPKSDVRFAIHPIVVPDLFRLDLLLLPFRPLQLSFPFRHAHLLLIERFAQVVLLRLECADLSIMLL